MHAASSHLQKSDDEDFSKETMPRIKLTARKEGPERSGDSKEEDEGQKETKRVLQKCRSTSYCPVCNRQFGQKFNMLRHLAVVHEKDEAGKDLDEEEKRRFASYNTKKLGAQRVTKRKKPKTPAVVHHLTSSSS